MKKPVCFLVYFLLLSLFTHQRFCAADLSSDLTLLNGRLGTLKLKLAELSTALQKLKDSLKPKSSPDPDPSSSTPPSIPISTPVSTSEYTLEEFQKLLETTPPHPTPLKTPSTPGPLSPPAIPEYNKADFAKFWRESRSLPRARTTTDMHTTRIEVNKQKQKHSCGYHALCNSLHFFNVFDQNDFYSFPDVVDFSLFEETYKNWRKLVQTESQKLVSSKILSKKIDIYDSDSGDLTPIVFNMIKEGDSDIKKLWDNGVLIYFPYSSIYHSIIDLDIDLADHYDFCIKKFYANNVGILIWNLGLKEHFYTLCVIRREKRLIKYVCDSENLPNLLHDDQGGTIIKAITQFLSKNESFGDFYALRLLNEIEENKIDFIAVFRLLQGTPSVVNYFKSFSDEKKQLIVGKINTSTLTDPGKNYDLIPENKRDIRLARATFAIKNLFAHNRDIDQRIHVEAFETDKIYYLHYKDEDTATKKPGSKDLSDYCFKTTINPKTMAEKPAYSKFDESITVGEPKLIPTK